MGKSKLTALIGILTIMLFAGDYVVAQCETTPGIRIQAKFDKMDTDKDGKISHDEYMGYHHKVAQIKFAWIDVDGDGFASWKEHDEGVRQLMGVAEHKAMKKDSP